MDSSEAGAEYIYCLRTTAADGSSSHGGAFNALMRRGEYGAARIAWRRVIAAEG